MSKITDTIIQPPVLIFTGFAFLMLIVYVVLPFNYAVPLWLPINIFFTVLMVGFMYGFHLYTDIQFCPEAPVLIKARKTNIPVLMVHGHQGFFRMVAGEKEKEGNIIYKHHEGTNEGLKIDPSVQSGHIPKSFSTKSLQMFHYGTGVAFPTGSKEAIAQDEILRTVREKHPILNVFDGQTILEHLARNRAELPHDCRNLAKQVDIDVVIPEEELLQFRTYINEEAKKKALEMNITDDSKIKELSQNMYEASVRDFVIDYRANYLVKEFMAIQDESAKLPLPPGRFFSFAEAFMNTYSAFTAYDYQTIMQLFEMIAKKMNEMDLKWLVGICVGVGILAVLAALAYQMIGSLPK